MPSCRASHIPRRATGARLRAGALVVSLVTATVLALQAATACFTADCEEHNGVVTLDGGAPDSADSCSTACGYALGDWFGACTVLDAGPPATIECRETRCAD